MSSNQFLIDSLTRRQIFIQRYSKGEARRLLLSLKKLSKQVKSEIGEDFDALRVKALIIEISRLTDLILEKFGDDLIKGATQFAKAEVAFVDKAIITGTAAVSLTKPTVEQLLAIFTNEKMGLISGQNVAKVSVPQLVKLFTRKKTSQITQIIRDGAANGVTSQQLTSRILDHINTRTRIQAESLVRTVTNHVAAQARESVYRANDDVIEGERFVATLDGRTTVICAAEDGEVHPIGVGPTPPLHWGCRSIRVPIIKPEFNLGSEVTGKRSSLKGPIDARVTYGGWLKDQPAKLQDEVLGVERAKLFRSGKLSIGRFTDDTGKVYTLEQLELLNPLAFE